MASNDADYKSLFFNAAHRGDLMSIRKLIAEQPDLMKTENSDGRLPLHLFVRMSEEATAKEAVSMLLNRGIDINMKDKLGQTVLHALAQWDSYSAKDRIGDLLTFGADIEARDNKGRTPLHWAAHAARYDFLAGLIKNNAAVNAADNEGVTPLHLAAQRGETAFVSGLLAAGADVDAVTRDGRHVWDFAIAAGKDYQAQMLKAESRRRAEAAAKKAQAAVAKAEKERDPWTLLAHDRIARVTDEKLLGYKLTEIFNFSARTYTQMVHNVSTKTEATALKTFDEFADKTLIETAHTALQRLGGTAPAELINGPVVNKPRPALKVAGGSPAA